MRLSLERLEARAAAAQRRRAAETLELVQGIAIAHGGKNSTWRSWQQQLIGRIKNLSK